MQGARSKDRALGMELVERPQHFVPTVFAKIDGMRASFRIPKADSSVEDTPLVQQQTTL